MAEKLQESSKVEQGPEYLQIMLNEVTRLREEFDRLAQPDPQNINGARGKEIQGALDRYAERCVREMRQLNIGNSLVDAVLSRACKGEQQWKALLFIKRWGKICAMARAQEICHQAHVFVNCAHSRLRFLKIAPLDEHLSVADLAEYGEPYEIEVMNARATLGMAISDLLATFPSFLDEKVVTALKNFDAIRSSNKVDEAAVFQKTLQEAVNYWSLSITTDAESA